MHLTPYAIRNKKIFQNFGKSKKALARFPPTTVLNNCISPELNPCLVRSYSKICDIDVKMQFLMFDGFAHLSKIKNPEEN